MTLDQAKQQITTFVASLGATLGAAAGLTSTINTPGKVYEAWTLAWLLHNLRVVEGFTPTLVLGSKAPLKSAPGPINRNYPFFDLQKPGFPSAEVWTDVEFSTLSASHTGLVCAGQSHELDISVTSAGLNGYPPHDEVWLGVECKNTTFQKRMLREVLGLRRELSFLQPQTRTRFAAWPTTFVPAQPPSSLLAVSIDPGVVVNQPIGDYFGIQFVNLPL